MILANHFSHFNEWPSCNQNQAKQPHISWDLVRFTEDKAAKLFSFLEKKVVLSFSHKTIASKDRICQVAVFFLLLFCQFCFLLLLNALRGLKILSKGWPELLRINRTLFKNVISMNLIIPSQLSKWAEKLINGGFFAFLHWFNSVSKSLVKNLLKSEKSVFESCLSPSYLPS